MLPSPPSSPLPIYAKAQKPNMSLAMNKMKVLAVDDNRTNLHILQVFLKKLGHEVILAENGEEAVRASWPMHRT